MRQIAIVLAISFLIFVSAAYAFSQDSTKINHDDPELKLVVTTIDEHFCSDEEMVFRLRLTFSNEGKTPILLDPNSKLVWRYQVIEKKSKQITKPIISVEPYYKLQDVVKLERTPVLEDFIVLEPGETHSLEIGQSLDVSDGSKETMDDLQPGAYSLILRVGTWYFNPLNSDKYRA